MLPAEFAALETYSDWVLETESQRYTKCLASTMTEMQAFCSAASPLLDRAMTHLGKFPLGNMSSPERNLMLLMMSLITVSPLVEAPDPRNVAGGGAACLQLVAEPGA